MEGLMCQKRNGEWLVSFGWCQIVEFERLVEDVNCFAAAGLFEAGGHAADGVSFPGRKNDWPIVGRNVLGDGQIATRQPSGANF